MAECVICRAPLAKGRKVCSPKCAGKHASNAALSVNCKTIAQSYDDFVIRNGEGCWGWKGCTVGGGYACIKRSGTSMYMHRYVYEQAVGPIPAGMIVRHKCDNPICTNPDHLEIGTHKDNSRDMSERGRTLIGPRNPAAKLDEGKVADIKRAIRGGESQSSLARRYGVCQQAISNINRGLVWRHVA